MYKITKVSAIFFIFYAVIGIYFLTGIIIATFEVSYSKKKPEELKAYEQAKTAALCYAFVLTTWSVFPHSVPLSSARDLCIDKENFVKLMVKYWNATEKIQSVVPQQVHTITSNLTQFFHSTQRPQLHQAQHTNLESLLAVTTFQTMDIDDSGSVEFDEFFSIFTVASCVEMIKNDPLLAHRMIATRWELELAHLEDTYRDAGLRESVVYDTAHKDDLNRFLTKARQNVVEQIDKIERQFALFGIRWRYVNKVLVAVMMVHGYMLSLYGSTVSADAIYTISAVLSCFYAFELTFRVVWYGGASAFCKEAIYPYRHPPFIHS